MKSATENQLSRHFLLGLLGVLAILVVPLIWLFHTSFASDQVLFSNDGPLGVLVAAAKDGFSSFKGVWLGLNWLGMHQPSALPDFTQAIYGLLGPGVFGDAGPINFAKFYAPLSLLILGGCAWFYFRTLGFASAVCVLGGLAAALNSNFFSNACWGLPTRALTLANVFLALAAIDGMKSGRPFLKAALAGVAIGLSLMEGYDVAAIFSVFVAAYCLLVALNESGTAGRRWASGVARIAVMTVFAAIVAAQALNTLVGTQVKGIVQTNQSAKSSEANWSWATQWSLPKLEALRVVVPGIYGYRMDTPDGGQYWGAVGQQPGWEEHHQGSARSSGAGEYAGVLVVLIAMWAVAQAARRRVGPFDRAGRRVILFWVVAGVVSMLIAFGRHAPFYSVLYALPFSSLIRGPLKFMHVFHLSLMILFAYGLNDLFRRYMTGGVATTAFITDHLKKWWTGADGFDRRWVYGCFGAILLSLAGLLIYASSGPGVERYLISGGFSPEDAKLIIRHSISEVVFFCALLIMAVVGLVVILSGYLKGTRARWGLFLLGVLLVGDLVHANTPWVIYYDYKAKYATNPVIDILRAKPWEQRVSAPPFLSSPQAPYFPAICNEWLQQHFQYYRIQSLDVSQMPREPVDHKEYMALFNEASRMPRLWELTNTRYLLGMSGFADVLNAQLDPGKKRFRVHTAFEFAQGADGAISTVIKPDGSFAILEFSGALPRAKLYRHWQVTTSDEMTLSMLVKPEFDPASLVLVADEVPEKNPASQEGSDAGTVEIKDYKSKRVEVSANAVASSVLLLNDRYDANWKVSVDGQPEKVLRCNYLMRGVYLKPGQHTVVFQFDPSVNALYVSIAGLCAGLLMCGILLISPRQSLPANQ
jgi:hypothetical protein